MAHHSNINVIEHSLLHHRNFATGVGNHPFFGWGAQNHHRPSDPLQHLCQSKSAAYSSDGKEIVSARMSLISQRIVLSQQGDARTLSG